MWGGLERIRKAFVQLVELFVKQYERLERKRREREEGKEEQGAKLR
jgi:hypothetical protein